MAKLVIDLSKTEDILFARLFLANIEMPNNEPVKVTTGKSKAAEVLEPELLEDDFDMGGTVTEEEDLLGDLLGEEEPEVPAISVDDMKDAFKALATAKGKDAAMTLVKKAFAKMGVEKMESIQDEKRETFVKILMAAAK